MDRFDEMRGKSQGGGGEYVEGNTPGFLPMPIAGLNVSQDISKRGRVTISMAIPDDAENVDILIKKNDYPESYEDYFQKISLDKYTNTLTAKITPNEDGNYENEYGFWAVSKNTNGIQTALSGSNMKMFTTMYAKDVREAVYTGAIGSSFIGRACIKKVGNLIFFSTSSSNADNSGLYLLDTETNTIKKLTDSYRNYMHLIDLRNGYFLLGGTGNSYVYNHNDGSFTSVSSASGFNKYVTSGEMIIVRNSSGYVKGWNTTTCEMTDYGLSSYDIIKTSSGVFAFASNVQTVKRYDRVTNSFEDCYAQDYNDEGGYNEPYLLNKTTCKIFVDTHDNFYLTQGTYTSSPVYTYSGNFMETKYQTWTSSFLMDNEYYFVINSALYKFAVDGIRKVCPSPVSSFGSTVIKAIKFHGVNVIFTSAKEIYVFDGEKLTKLATNYDKDFLPFEYNEKIYYKTNSSTTGTSVISYSTDLDENGDEIGCVISTYSTTYYYNFKEVNGVLFATDKNYAYVYRLFEDKTVKTLVTTGSNYMRYDIKEENGLVYLIQVHKYAYAPSYLKTYNKVFEYNVETEEITELTTKKGGMMLGIDKYFYPYEGLVYSIVDDEQTVSITDCNYYTDYLEGSNANTNYSNYAMAGYITSTQMKIIYLV